MAKIMINLPNDVHQILKALAKSDERSLAQYVSRGLRYLADMPIPYHELIKSDTSSIPISNTPRRNIIINDTPNTNTYTTNTYTTNTYTNTYKGLAKEEYARKLMAEAKTEKALEKEELRAQKNPEQQILDDQKLDLQKQKVQEKRNKLLRDRALELGLDFANNENFNEDYVLFEIYDVDWVNAKFDEEHYNKFNPYRNKPIEELYSLLDKIKAREDEEHSREAHREELPHDINDYNYKSEDFIEDVNHMKDIWRRENGAVYEDEEDYKVLFDYFLNTHLYHDFEAKMNHPYDAFDPNNQRDMQLLMNAFNRSNIDVDYINAVMYGQGKAYRQEHKCEPYFNK